MAFAPEDPSARLAGLTGLPEALSWVWTQAHPDRISTLFGDSCIGCVV